MLPWAAAFWALAAGRARPKSIYRGSVGAQAGSRG